MIDNALKYAEKNTTVIISSIRQQSGILIQVADEGIGIKNEFKELIFERFLELETKKQEILKELVWGYF